MNDVGLAWQREPVVLAIAHALLDLIDQGPKERIRAPRLRLQAENVPGLFSGSARESDYQWSLVQKMEQARWITIVTDRHPPGEPGYYRQARAVLCDEHALRELTGRALSDAPNWQDRFMQALGTRLPADHPALAEAMRFPLPLRAYDPEVVADRLLSVGALLDTPLLLREVASQLFFAQSKALDGKASLIAALLGLPECPFPDMPLHLAVALPAQPFNGVLFIENLTAFDSVGHRRSASTATLALVYASGYRCSARRLRMKDGASVYFSASSLPSEAKAAAFSTWLIRGGAELPVFFYGDLDFAGMSILARLRDSFHNAVAWPPGYGALLDTLERGGGHTAEAAAKVGQLDPGSTGCPYADDVLLPALRRTKRFVDQEFCRIEN